MERKEIYQKTGYLTSDFRFFYLTSTEARDFQSHYHDFHKLLFFQSGSLSYYIEGETYDLQPGDIVLVPAGEVHRPLIHGTLPYHRLILYLSPAFFERYAALGYDLFRCFSRCSECGSHVLRFQRIRESRLFPKIKELMEAAQEKESDFYAAPLYRETLLLQFLILLNQAAEGRDLAYPAASGANPQILRILTFINEHLQEELSVDRIAAACYLNRSYLMHLFRKETGYTLGAYITEKRLFLARTLIQSGASVAEAGERSGFSSYTSFYRAYRRKFEEAPRDSRICFNPRSVISQNTTQIT